MEQCPDGSEIQNTTRVKTELIRRTRTGSLCMLRIPFDDLHYIFALVQEEGVNQTVLIRLWVRSGRVPTASHTKTQMKRCMIIIVATVRSQVIA